MYSKIENCSWCVKIRNVRKKKRITQEGLARNTGISQSRISHIESGRVDPKLTEVIAMATALDMGLGMYPSAAVPFVADTLREWRRCDDPTDLELTIPELILGERALA
ncbi:MAG: helix-turn-helix transcriptional regulator [Gammaproteobacteria bacterium]|nr:helix-turn-helix transcriptional regulator [Gammaproteobacteria bacterium]